MKISFLPSNS